MRAGRGGGDEHARGAGRERRQRRVGQLQRGRVATAVGVVGVPEHQHAGRRHRQPGAEPGERPRGVGEPARARRAARRSRSARWRPRCWRSRCAGSAPGAPLGRGRRVLDGRGPATTSRPPRRRPDTASGRPGRGRAEPCCSVSISGMTASAPKNAPAISPRSAIGRRDAGAHRGTCPAARGRAGPTTAASDARPRPPPTDDDGAGAGRRPRTRRRPRRRASASSSRRGSARPVPPGGAPCSRRSTGTSSAAPTRTNGSRPRNTQRQLTCWVSDAGHQRADQRRQQPGRRRRDEHLGPQVLGIGVADHHVQAVISSPPPRPCTARASDELDHRRRGAGDAPARRRTAPCPATSGSARAARVAELPGSDHADDVRDQERR